VKEKVTLKTERLRLCERIPSRWNCESFLCKSFFLCKSWI